MSENEPNTNNEIETYRFLLLNLSTKVKFALDDAKGELSRELTWKQRNSAKKLGWGACTAIGMLLFFSNVLPYLDNSVIETALSELFRCIQLSNVINEKIAVAAVNALGKVPRETWELLSNKCDSIGRGLATCFSFLYEVSFPIVHT